MIVKQFNEFEGTWFDVTGTSTQTLKFDASGVLQVNPIVWGDISGTLSNQTDLQTLLDTKPTQTGWIDYSGDATITGFSSTSKVNIFYNVVGETMTLNFYIEGASNADDFKFSLPYSTQSNMDVIVPILRVDNGVYGFGSIVIPASVNEATLYVDEDITTDNWTTSGNKKAYGSISLQVTI